MPPRPLRSRNWCFTAWPTPGEVLDGTDSFYKEDRMQYLLMGKETCPNTQRLHWQCFVQLMNPAPFASVVSLLDFNVPPHIEACRGSPAQNIAYCKKDGDWVDYGEATGLRIGQGSRTDLTSTVAVLETGVSLESLLTDPEHGSVIARHMQYFARVAESITNRGAVTDARASFEGAILRTWQNDLLTEISTVPDPRKVFWFWDDVGGTGKSWFANFMVAKHDAIIFTNGRLADMALAYQREPVVVFDLSRTQAEKIDAIYMAMEQFKNGRIFSPKYHSATKVFRTPHVVVFANYPPDETKLSADRWMITRLD